MHLLRDIGTYVRLHDFGRDTGGVNLSSLAMMRYTIKDPGKRHLALDAADGECRIEPASEPGSGQIRAKDK